MKLKELFFSNSFPSKSDDWICLIISDTDCRLERWQEPPCSVLRDRRGRPRASRPVRVRLLSSGPRAARLQSCHMGLTQERQRGALQVCCLAGYLTVSRTFPLSPPCLCSLLWESEKALCSLQKAASYCILSVDTELPCSHSPSSIMSLDLSNFLERSSVSQNLAIMGSLNSLWKWETFCLPRI